MKRYVLRPDQALSWLAVLGFLCYAVAWQGYRTFYEAFSVTPQMAGISYEAIVVPAAISAFLLLLVMVSGISMVAPVFLPAFMRTPAGTARIHLKSGLLLGAVFWTWAAIRRVENESPAESFLIALGEIVSLVLVAAGLNVLINRATTRLWFRCLHAFRARVLHQATESVAHDYLVARRRQKRQRTSQSRLARRAGPVVRIMLLFIAVFLVMAYIAYLDHAAEHVARSVVANKPYDGLDRYAAGILLKPTATRVAVIAADAAFRPLEKSRLLYLGRSDGAYVLYDISSRKALVVPSGSIALQFGSSDSLSSGRAESPRSG
jgi:hypothetical protein